jgi:hypothetical protein
MALDCEGNYAQTSLCSDRISLASGISDQALPSSNLPEAFFRIPPYCWKKKGTFFLMHRSLRERTHSRYAKSKIQCKIDSVTNFAQLFF